MKSIFLFILFWSILPASAQQRTGGKKETWPPHTIHAGLLLPLGDFSSTHAAGFAAGYAPALLKNKKKTGFSWQGGFACFTGKKETVGGNSYRYPVYLLLQAGGLLQYRLSEKFILQWIAGSGISRYDGSNRFILNSRISAAYSVRKQLSAGPQLYWIKESGASALWSAGICCFIYLQ